MENYTVDATKALRLQLVRSPDAVEQLEDDERAIVSAEFAPTFVYPIFGEAETIYGYSQDLTIRLQMAAGNLLTHLSVSYTDQLPASETTKPDDIEGKLYEHLAADYLTNEATFLERVKAEEKTFKPGKQVGRRIGCYGRKLVVPNPKGKGKQSDNEGDEPYWDECDPAEEGAVVYEAWAADLSTPGFRDLHRRMQIFILLYIEGGSYLDEEDSKWEYEKRKDVYSFVGYTSLYRFFHYPDTTRLRLSQFVILPPYQGCGHGAHLYSITYFWLLTRPEVSELTVEDPSEGFQDLRDKIDLGVLLAQEAHFSLPIDKAMVKETRAAMKLGERQFARLMEMSIMLRLGENVRDNKEYRLMVKERLYRFSGLLAGISSVVADGAFLQILYVLYNCPFLACPHLVHQDKIKQLSPEERKEKLAQTFEAVISEYERLVSKLLPGQDDALDAINEEDEEEAA